MKVKKYKRVLGAFSFLFVIALFFSFSSASFAEEEFFTGTETREEIIYDNGIHYMEDPNFPNERIPLFCMNNKLHWPHLTPDLGNVQVPGYKEGYLTPSDFQTEDEYNKCMERLSKLLYVGYPNNAEQLYKIVNDTSGCMPTEEEFNEMLLVPTDVQTAFPYLENHRFFYSDWSNQQRESLDTLNRFVNEVVTLDKNQTTTINGFTYHDIITLPFYKAAFCMTLEVNGNPLESFSHLYGASYYVTEQQAYTATQEAIWYLLQEYKIAENNLSTMSFPLSNVLYRYSEYGRLLDKEPSISELRFSEDLNFSYNPKDGMWHSTKFQVEEPPEYKGKYTLNLPNGMKIAGSKTNEIIGNECYELISDGKPVEGQPIEIAAQFVWLKEMRQYSPSPDIEVNTKKFQRMIGAVVRTTNLGHGLQFRCDNVGELCITKQVKGEEQCQEAFLFELRFPNNPNIHGVYGALKFNEGVAAFSLKDGETVRATHLPANERYEIIEKDTQEYQVDSTNAKGEIIKDVVQYVTFTNTKCYDLSLSKIVEGKMGDKTKKFTMIVQLTSQSGKPVKGSFSYTGSVKEEIETEVDKPKDGTIFFENGRAEILLSHGQQITIHNLPPNTNYIVEEKEANQKYYKTFYNGTEMKPKGILDKDTVITVMNQKEIIPETGVMVKHRGSGSAAVIGIVGIIFLYCIIISRRKG